LVTTIGMRVARTASAKIPPRSLNPSIRASAKERAGVPGLLGSNTLPEGPEPLSVIAFACCSDHGRLVGRSVLRRTTH